MTFLFGLLIIIRVISWWYNEKDQMFYFQVDIQYCHNICGIWKLLFYIIDKNKKKWNFSIQDIFFFNVFFSLVSVDVMFAHLAIL